MMINPVEVAACMGEENMMNHFKSDDIWIVKLAVKKMIQLLTKYPQLLTKYPTTLGLSAAVRVPEDTL